LIALEDTLIELLEYFNLPVIRQGSLPPDEAYPDTFFTFWNNEEIEQSAYDNDTATVVFDFDVNVYSTNPDTAYDLLQQARSYLKQNGWIIAQRGYDLTSDEITHIGRGMEVLYLKQFEQIGGN
jgi:hypothetical protein